MTGKVFILLGDLGAGKSYAAKYIFGARDARPGNSARNVTKKQEEFENENGDIVVDCVGYDHSNKLPSLSAFRDRERCFVVLLLSPRTDDKLIPLAKRLNVSPKNLNPYFGYNCGWLVEPKDARYPGVRTFEKLAEDYREGKLKFVKPEGNPNRKLEMSVSKPLPSEKVSKEVVMFAPSKGLPPSTQLLLREGSFFSATSRLSDAELNLDGYDPKILLVGVNSLSRDDVKNNRAIGETVLKIHLQFLKRRGLPINLETSMRNNEMRKFLRCHKLEDRAIRIYGDRNRIDSDEKIADVLEAIFGVYAGPKTGKTAKKVFIHFLAAYTHWCVCHKVSGYENSPSTSHDGIPGSSKKRSRSEALPNEPGISNGSRKKKKAKTEMQACGNPTQDSTSNESSKEMEANKENCGDLTQVSTSNEPNQNKKPGTEMQECGISAQISNPKEPSKAKEPTTVSCGSSTQISSSSKKKKPNTEMQVCGNPAQTSAPKESRKAKESNKENCENLTQISTLNEPNKNEKPVPEVQAFGKSTQLCNLKESSKSKVLEPKTESCGSSTQTSTSNKSRKNKKPNTEMQACGNSTQISAPIESSKAKEPTAEAHGNSTWNNTSNESSKTNKSSKKKEPSTEMEVCGVLEDISNKSSKNTEMQACGTTQIATSNEFSIAKESNTVIQLCANSTTVFISNKSSEKEEPDTEFQIKITISTGVNERTLFF